MRVRSVLLFVLMLTITSVSAQNKRDGGRQKFNIEKAKERQAAFFVKELNLTDAEAKAFIPILNEFTDKKYEANKTVWQLSSALRKQERKADADYQKVVDAYLESKIKEAQLQKEYYQKFQKVLSAEKLYKLQRAEMKFMQRMLDERQKRKNNSTK